MKIQTAAVAVAANVGSVDNVAVDIYVAFTGVDNAAVGIPVAAAAGVANAVCVLSNNFAARHYLRHRIANCSLRRVLHCAVFLSVIKHTAELGCGKGLAAGIFRSLAHPTSKTRPAKRVAATDCKRLALNRQNAATAGCNGRRLNGLACRYFSQVRNRGALYSPAGEG